MTGLDSDRHNISGKQCVWDGQEVLMSPLNMTDGKGSFKNHGSCNNFIKFHGSCSPFYRGYEWFAILIFHKAVIDSHIFASLRVGGRSLKKVNMFCRIQL